MKKLDDLSTVYFFAGYKHESGGDRVWDPKRRVVAESRDNAFFDDGLPPPTLSQTRPLQDGDESLVHEFSSQSRSADAAERVRIIIATRDEAGGPTIRNARRRTGTQEYILLCLPGRLTERQDAHPA